MFHPSPSYCNVTTNLVGKMYEFNRVDSDRQVGRTRTKRTTLHGSSNGTELENNSMIAHCSVNRNIITFIKYLHTVLAFAAILSF